MTNFMTKYGEWAIVTGASSGIGTEFARQTASRGISVVLVARRQDRLEQLADEIESTSAVQTRVIAADLTTDTGLEGVIEETSDLEVDLLINNAGREDSGPSC